MENACKRLKLTLKKKLYYTNCWVWQGQYLDKDQTTLKIFLINEMKSLIIIADSLMDFNQKQNEPGIYWSKEGEIQGFGIFNNHFNISYTTNPCK